MSPDAAPRNLSLLDNFLIGSFDPSEFRVFLGQHCGEPLLAELPLMPETPRSFFSRTVRTLERHGMIDGALFDALGRERPRRRVELQRLAACLSVTPLPDDEVRTIVWRHLEDEGERRRVDTVEALEAKLVERERIERDDAGRILLDAEIDRLARVLRQADPPGPGSVVAGSRLERFLGAGNFGTVWLAHHIRSGEPVATKIFNLDRLTEGVMLWRFRRSIRALQALASIRRAPDSVPRLLEVGSDSLAFTMPYFSGGTLERIDRRGWSLGVKLERFLATCRAVEFAHRAGVIHRDIKPANVLLDASSRVVLIDYDIADIRFVTELSVAKGGLGTPVFAAPEQLEGADAADERSDIYSLGRLLHYMLIERSPGYQIERDPDLENLAGYGPALVQIVRRATQWSPTRRYSSVSELIAALERHHTGRAAALARLRGATRWVRKNTAALAVFSTITSTGLALAAQREGMLTEVRALTADVDALHRETRALHEEYARLEQERDALARLPAATLSPEQTDRLRQLDDDLLPKQRQALARQDVNIDRLLSELRVASGAATKPAAAPEQRVEALNMALADVPAARALASILPLRPGAPPGVESRAPHGPETPASAELQASDLPSSPGAAVPPAPPPAKTMTDPPRPARRDRKSRLPAELSREDFKAVINRVAGAAMRACIHEKKDKYETQPSFQAEFAISADGTVARLTFSTRLMLKTEECVRGATRDLKFPPARNEVNHAYEVK